MTTMRTKHTTSTGKTRQTPNATREHRLLWPDTDIDALLAELRSQDAELLALIGGTP